MDWGKSSSERSCVSLLRFLFNYRRLNVIEVIIINSIYIKKIFNNYLKMIQNRYRMVYFWTTNCTPRKTSFTTPLMNLYSIFFNSAKFSIQNKISISFVKFVNPFFTYLKKEKKYNFETWLKPWKPVFSVTREIKKQEFVCFRKLTKKSWRSK